jgi:hypothetical protein
LQYSLPWHVNISFRSCSLFSLCLPYCIFHFPLCSFSSWYVLNILVSRYVFFSPRSSSLLCYILLGVSFISHLFLFCTVCSIFPCFLAHFYIIFILLLYTVYIFLFCSRSYLEGLCTTLYDVLRPFIIHINHLETLAEVCSILRLEMLEEHVQNNREYTALYEGCEHCICNTVLGDLAWCRSSEVWRPSLSHHDGTVWCSWLSEKIVLPWKLQVLYHILYMLT